MSDSRFNLRLTRHNVSADATLTHNQCRRRANRPAAVFSGDHIRKVTPVPIPNTVVKLSEPMVVPKVRE